MRVTNKKTRFTIEIYKETCDIPLVFRRIEKYKVKKKKLLVQLDKFIWHKCDLSKVRGFSIFKEIR